MKTTVEISDVLLREAKKYAAERGVTLREVIEAGLRDLVAKRDAKRKPFKLRRCAFKGTGMVKDFTWDEILNLTYEGRGGVA
jgi:hypothetical protein